MLTTKDIIDIAYNTSDKLFRRWNIAISIHFVLVGWLLTVKTDLAINQKIIITIIYVCFTSVNFIGLAKDYMIFDNIMKEFREHSKGNIFKAAEVNKAAQNLKYRHRLTLITVLFVVFVTLSLLMLWKGWYAA